MAKYHITAGKIRDQYMNKNDSEPLENTVQLNPKQLNFILDCMRGCSQLRQSKVIESFFTEIFKEAKTEFIEIDGKFGKFQKLKVIE